MTRVGFVGAGRMGLPMVERLAAAGHDVVVHARRPEARSTLEELGVRATADIAEAAADREIAIVCLYSDEQLAEVAPPLAGALPAGAVLATHVTGRASTVTELAETFPGIEVVDAPVSGTQEHIRAGQLTVLLGGSPEARDAAAEVISCYADPIIDTGQLGTALPAKLVNNLLMAANSQLLAESLELGARLGVEPPALLSALEHMSGGSKASHYMVEHGGIESFAAESTPFLVKDVHACREQAAQLGLDLGLLDEVIGKGKLPLG